MSVIAIAAAIAAFLVFAVRRLLSYLHLFQQDEYDGWRFLKWIAATGSVDRRVSLALLAIGAVALWRPPDERWGVVVALLAVLTFMLAARAEPDPRKVAKKKLAMTARAKRILGLALAIAAALGASFFWIPPVAWIVPVQLLPVALVAGNLALVPFERIVQRRYWREAHEKLMRLNPTVVAITGSYGKTSVKHILGHILGMAGPTLITPGSVNTPMGVARVIRESLGPEHRFFVVEMGAYGPGSIARLCALAPPQFGVLTAIGKAHYERYKSLDTVARTKFELGDAVERSQGKLVLWAETLGFPAGEAFARAHPQSLVVCGPAGAALVLREVRATPDGVAAAVTWQGRPYVLAAPLFGAHHGRNIALAFCAAATLGIPPETAELALRSTPQIAHRLEVKRQATGAVVIDDAYNSNPEGFAAALETLDLLGKPEGRRILVTPGMVELGASHEEEHRRLGRLAARVADVLLAVAPARIRSFVDAFRAAAPEREVVACATFDEAQQWLSANLSPRDVVLLENDLPDLFERRMRL